MQKWIDHNDILKYSIHNESKYVVTKRFIRTLKSKICKNMKAKNKKSDFGYFNKLVDEYSSRLTIVLFIKKSVDADLFCFD